MITDKHLHRIITGRPIIWLIVHPDPAKDNSAWLLDERTHQWDFDNPESWKHNSFSAIEGIPSKPWPEKVEEWILDGIEPIVISLYDVKYVDTKYKDWWDNLYQINALKAWILGWNLVNENSKVETWKDLSLEYKMLTLETSIALKKKIRPLPNKNRFKKCLDDTIKMAERENNDLLLGVIKQYAFEWKKL